MPIVGQRSQHFRYIYSNGFGLQTGGQEVVISFGFKDNPQGADEEINNEVAVVMLPATLKFLALSLEKLVELIEKANGAKIPFEATKLEPLEKAIEAIISPAASQPPP